MTIALTRARMRDPTETQIQTAVIQHWRVNGVVGSLLAAIPNANSHGQPGLTRGLPDLIAIRKRFVGFLELKTGRGTLSKAQETILWCLADNNIPHAVTYGRDEPIKILREWGVIR